MKKCYAGRMKRALTIFVFMVAVALYLLAQSSSNPGSGSSGGSGTVGPGTINSIAKFTAATTVGNSALTDNGTLITSTEAIQVPAGAFNSTSLNFAATNPSGFFLTGGGSFATQSAINATFNTNQTWFLGLGSTNQALFAGASNAILGWSSLGSPNGTAIDSALSQPAASLISVGANINQGNESGYVRWNNCKVTADITLPVNTATTVCAWSLPASARTWAWQCQIPWVISAGTGTNTLAIIANASQTPTGTTNGSAEIKTTNTNTATEATTAISASGATTLLTSGTITPAATVFMSSTSGTLLASGTAGSFSIQMTAAGTTATAAAKAGATCTIY